MKEVEIEVEKVLEVHQDHQIIKIEKIKMIFIILIIKLIIITTITTITTITAVIMATINRMTIEIIAVTVPPREDPCPPTALSLPHLHHHTITPTLTEAVTTLLVLPIPPTRVLFTIPLARTLPLSSAQPRPTLLIVILILTSITMRGTANWRGIILYFQEGIIGQMVVIMVIVVMAEMVMVMVELVVIVVETEIMVIMVIMVIAMSAITATPSAAASVTVEIQISAITVITPTRITTIVMAETITQILILT